MSVAAFTLEGSFRGIPFLFHQTSKTFGRKVVVDEIPNSNSRNTYDLGELKPIYTMVICLTGSGADYYDNKTRFEKALTSFSKGILVHPTDGSVNVQVSSCTLIESIAEVGKAGFNVTFIATTDPQFPTLSGNAQPSIQNSFVSTVDAVVTAFNASYSVTSSYQNALLKYRGYFQNVIDKYNNVVDLVSVNKNTLSIFINNLQDVQDNRNDLVKTGSGISSAVIDTHNNMIDLNNDTQARSILNQSLFGLIIAGQDYSNTLSRVEAQKNRRLIQQLVNTNALVYEYLNTSQTTYFTEDSIKAQSSVIEDQFYFILNNNFYDNTTGNRIALFDETVIDKLSFLRDRTTQYLEQQLTNAKQISTVFVQNRSLLDIITSVYGDVSLYETIAQLNSLANQAVITGDIKLLTS